MSLFHISTFMHVGAWQWAWAATRWYDSFVVECEDLAGTGTQVPVIVCVHSLGGVPAAQRGTSYSA